MAPGAQPNSYNPQHVPESSSYRDVRGTRTAIFIQDECFKHRFIRSRDTSGIFERPERLHALKLGLAAAISRIEESTAIANKAKRAVADEDELVVALAGMTITPTMDPTAPGSGSCPSSKLRTDSVTIRKTSVSVSLLDHAAVKYVHGDIDGDVYLENLVEWARDSQKNISENGTEIPKGLPPLDLYLCPESIDAIQGALGAVCEAVDACVAATRGPLPRPNGPDDPCERAFVAIRPPGHHCGEDSPSGFCFVNNVAVGAAHAHLNHGIQRMVILDIDLHHGNGTQSIAWQINEETYRQMLEAEETGIPPAKPGPRIFYGSLHDILSFPCENGAPGMIQAASTSIHGPHGQYIENVHLQKCNSEAHFWDALYPKYLTLLHRARDFLDDTGGPGDDIIVFISCGFDAGEHEYPEMSRHQRKVPVGFYHRFARDTCSLADSYASGRLVSVLEGGYSDRALTSGAMAHLCGLVDPPTVDPTWWSERNLIKLEKAAKSRRTADARANVDEWLSRTVCVLSMLSNGPDATSKVSSISARGTNSSIPLAPMTLRERKKKPVLDQAGGAPPATARAKRNQGRSASSSIKQSTERTVKLRVASPVVFKSESDREVTETGNEAPPRIPEKKLPRVTLIVRPPDIATACGS